MTIIIRAQYQKALFLIRINHPSRDKSNPPKKGYINRTKPTYCCSQFSAHPPTISPIGAVRLRYTVKQAAITTKTVRAILLKRRMKRA